MSQGKVKVVLEYIWLDNDYKFRSKSRTLEVTGNDDLEVNNLPHWTYDGSSTSQASGDNSEVILKPVRLFNCPFRGNNGFLILCDTYSPNGEPIGTNNRYTANMVFETAKEEEPWYGLEQEYFMIDLNTGKPVGWPRNGFPEEQGKYYCGVGAGRVFGRKVADLHYKLCLTAGVNISGINAEVAPGQWEFQVGPCTGIEAGDHLWMARYILERVAELSNTEINYDPKPFQGDWNGSGCHTNFSTLNMRRGTAEKTGLEYINDAVKILGQRHSEHMSVYGSGNERRMTGMHETAGFNTFTCGVADRGASVRIPLDTYKDKKGYFEDRRPASNCDPYLVTSVIFETIMSESI
jgi:glutamine synthetase